VHLVGATKQVTVTFRVTELVPPAATPSISVGAIREGGVVAFLKEAESGMVVKLKGVI
jgi:hypothetical protein